MDVWHRGEDSDGLRARRDTWESRTREFGAGRQVSEYLCVRLEKTPRAGLTPSKVVGLKW